MKHRPCKRCGALRLRSERTKSGVCRNRQHCDFVVSLTPTMEAIGLAVMEAMGRSAEKDERRKRKKQRRDRR